MTLTTCPGCTLVLPRAEGPTHTYVPTSPECWALFGRTSTEVNYRLLSDAYMVQHPDGDDRRQLQSVAVHLITLEAILRRGQPLSSASQVTAQAVEQGRCSGGYPKLNRPDGWTSTILDVAKGTVLGDTFADQVLTAWHLTEEDRIAEWTQSTLKSLYTS